MVIDLPASASQLGNRLGQGPVSQLVNQHQATLQAALKALNIRAGDTVNGLIREVHKVDNPLRVRLINLANPATPSAELSPNNTATTPVNSALGSQAAESLAAKLKSASLRLVELQVNNRSVLTLTEQPLKAGQQVTVHTAGGRLDIQPQLNNRPNQTQPPANAGQAPLPTSPSGQRASTAPTPAPTPSHAAQPNTSSIASGIRQTGSEAPPPPQQQAPAPSSVSSTPRPLTTAQQEVLQQALRTQLPQFSSPAQSLAEPALAAQLVHSLLQQRIGNPIRQQIPANLQQALRTVAMQLRTPEQLSQPANIKKAILDSGLQLENRLTKTGVQAGAANRNTGASQSLPSNTLQSDSKAALLKTLHHASVRPTSTPAASPNAAPPPAPPLSQEAGKQLLMQIKQLLSGSGIEQQRHSITINAEQITQLVQQQMSLAINRVLLLQLQSILRSQGNERADPIPTQHLQLEIPVRYGNEAHTISMYLDEDWVDDYSGQGSDSPAQKVRQWLVKLSFDLPDAGSFHAHITVLSDSVSASLWAEQDSTLAEAKRLLHGLRQGLEKDGIDVKQIECFAGKPVADQIKLEYALVDIKT